MIKAEVVGWERRARLPGHPKEIEIKVLPFRHWTQAGVNSEAWDSLEAGIGPSSEKKDARSSSTGCV